MQATPAGDALEAEISDLPLYLADDDIRKVVAGSQAEISRCYKTHALVQPHATGALSIHLLIHRKGALKSLEVVAPGVKGEALRTCIERAAQRWHFPARRRFTRAAMPFLFVRTRAPGAGPQLSCWDPRGCPKKNRR